MTAAAGLGVVLVAGLAVAVLTQTGEPGLVPEAGLPDPGPLTRWGLPTARALRDLTATMTIGLLVVASVILSGKEERTTRRLLPLRVRAVRGAAVCAVAWVVAGLIVLVFTYSDVSGYPVTTTRSPSELAWFVTDFDLGRFLAASVLLSALVAAGCFLRPQASEAGLLAMVALGALWPLAQTGHAASTQNHATAVNLMFAHLVAVATWVGGLAALALLHGDLRRDRDEVLRRYSVLAGCCFALVAVSGLIGGALRVEGWHNLTTPFGLLLLLKAAALGVLGVVGYMQRRILSRIAQGSRLAAQRRFVRLAVTELIFMGVAMGLGIALGRTPPPQPAERKDQTVAGSHPCAPWTRP
ncbi:MAG: copper resistance D family protein [Nocardioides sp.]